MAVRISSGVTMMTFLLIVKVTPMKVITKFTSELR